MKRILSSLLAVVMIFGATVALIPTKAEAAHSPSVETESKYTVEQINAIVQASYKYQFNTAKEMLDYELNLGYLDSVTNQSGTHTIYVNRYTGMLYYVDNRTEQILTSNPYNLNGVSSTAPKSLMSQIFISANTADKDHFSSDGAAERGQIKVSPISGGLRVSYTLGDTTTRYKLPGEISIEDYIEHVLKPILKVYEEKLEEYCRAEAPDEVFDFFTEETYNGSKIYDESRGGSIIVNVIRKYMDDTKKTFGAIYDSSSSEYIKLSDAHNRILSFINRYNANKRTFTEDGKEVEKYVYVLSGNATNKRNAEQLLMEYNPEYTIQNIIEDENKVGYVDKMVKKPVFRCSLEYTFNEDGSLSVCLPANSIVFDQAEYILYDISVLRFFGAGNLGEKGYVFIPDGSGSIINFDEFYSTTNNDLKKDVALRLKMYGEDYCYSMLDASSANREHISMPVFGAAYETLASNGTDKIETGYFAIIEEGASLSNLKVDFGAASHMYGNVYPIFSPFPRDEYDLSDTISVGDATSYTVVSESKYTGSYTMRYVMLSDPAVVPAGAEYTPASYSGMAAYYRNYLEKRGEITPLTEAADDLPLYIEAFGSIDVVKRILTFPVTTSIPLTTFDNVTTMYDELANAKAKLLEKAASYDELAAAAEAEKNLTLAKSHKARADKYRELSLRIYDITNVNFKLTGFTNGGMYYTYPTKVKWQSACGGKSGFRDLLDDVKDRQSQGLNFNVYPDFDFQYINNTSLFDGISNKGNVSKMVDNRYASKQEVNSILREYESIFAMVISPDALDKLYSKFYSKYSRYTINNISVSTLGSDLNSNFDKKNPINREESSKYVVELLDRMVNENEMSVLLSKGNIYSVKYADHILDMSIDSSHFSRSSYSIPFTGMVLHGYVNYTGSALNYSGSPDYDMLHAIENGASLYYILSYQNTEALKEDENLNKYYGVSYENWFDSVVDNYATLNEAIGKYQKYNIVDHTTLIAERVINPQEQANNFMLLREEILEMVDTQLLTKIDDTFEQMAQDSANNGRGIKVILHTDAIILQTLSLLNVTNDELCATDFDEKLAQIKAKYEAEYAGTSSNPEIVEFSQVDYQSQYKYVTDSLATDKDYVYTDFTVDNNLVTMVIYEDRTTGHRVGFLINYNIYSVEVNLGNGQVYTLDKYDFEPIMIGGANNG